MNKSFILISITVFTACAVVKLVPPSQPDVERVSTKYPGYSLAELNQGKALYEQTCNRCHRLKKSDFQE